MESVSLVTAAGAPLTLGATAAAAAGFDSIQYDTVTVFVPSNVRPCQKLSPTATASSTGQAPDAIARAACGRLPVSHKRRASPTPRGTPRARPTILSSPSPQATLPRPRMDGQ